MKILICLFSPSVRMIVEDPVFNSYDNSFLSGEEAFDSAMKKSAHYIEIIQSGKFISGGRDAAYLKWYVFVQYSVFHSVFCRMINNDFSTGVHEDMFVPAIKVREGEGVT